MQTYSARLTFTTKLLGSWPLDHDLYTRFIASKAPAAVAAGGNGAVMVKEIEAIPESDVKGRTGFARDEDDRPCLQAHQIKGFFKEAWRAMKGVGASESKELRAGIATIDRYLFVSPDLIPIRNSTGIPLDIYERPLKAQTAQGPRIALASSERLPPGVYIDIKIQVLAGVSEVLLREWLNYGAFVGIGQWRTGNNGRFEYQLKPWVPA